VICEDISNSSIGYSSRKTKKEQKNNKKQKQKNDEKEKYGGDSNMISEFYRFMWNLACFVICCATGYVLGFALSVQQFYC
jgi:hypothetical protein